MPALSVPSGTRSRRALRGLAAATALAVVPALGVANTATAQQGHRSTISQSSHDRQLAPRTHFTMQADGSSGLTAGGEGIPNIDSVKKTIATYYGDPGTGIADKTSSPYIAEMAAPWSDPEDLPQDGLQPRRQAGREARARLRRGRHHAVDVRHGSRGHALQLRPRAAGRLGPGAALPGHAGHGRASSTRQQRWGSPSSVSPAAATTRRPPPWQPGQGRVHRLHGGQFYTKWTGADANKPAYITCAAAKCTTVEYKAGTRKHIEEDLGYDIVLNVGDQWSDLQGGYADRS